MCNEIQHGDIAYDDAETTIRLDEAVQRAIGMDKPYDQKFKMHLNSEDKRILTSKDFQKGIACGKKYLEVAERYREPFKTLSIVDSRLYEKMVSFHKEFDEYENFLAVLSQQYDDYYDLPPLEVAKVICWWLEIGEEFAPYIKASMLGQELPDFIGDARVHVVCVTDNTQVQLLFDRGITAKTYKATWGGLRDFLKFDNLIIEENGKVSHNDTNRRIMRDWLRGYSCEQLAQKYYIEGNADPDIHSVAEYKDKIVKLIKRSGLSRLPIAYRNKLKAKLDKKNF